jgi:hypothetical protein
MDWMNESARNRAKRLFWQTVMGNKWAWFCLAICGLSGGAAGIYFAWGHGRTGTVVITVLCGAVGLVLGLLLIFLGLWFSGPTRQRDELKVAVREAKPATGDDRPVSVRIDRAPIWRNFNYQAYILEMHVAITNQTDSDVQLAGFAWHGLSRAELVGNDQLRAEVERTKMSRPQLGRHSIVEPSSTETGWVVAAYPFDSRGQPAELPDLEVSVSGYGSLKALR